MAAKASFAGAVAQNGCDTEASREALAGKTDAKVALDYTGNPVLSAYAPVKVGDLTWALLPPTSTISTATKAVNNNF